MRYEDWDVLLFPQDCKVPLKEFKVACHVIHDAEFSQINGSFGVPIVSCFVPSLEPGSPFQISIHSWNNNPPISQFTQSYTKHVKDVRFEARLFIDGSLVASASLGQGDRWPHIMAHSFDFSKNGDLQPLKFPPFCQELLQQSYWTPADDLGRIKIVISEGFPRDSLSMPIQRVKNVVTFSFQHAPLEVLEGSSIAWPNPGMWRRVPYTSSMPVPAYPSDDAESHAHSPRRRNKGGMCGNFGYSMPAIQGMTPARAAARKCVEKAGLGQFSTSSSFETGAMPGHDPNAYFDWLSNAGMSVDSASGEYNTPKIRGARKTSTDTSMSDYMCFEEKGQSSDTPCFSTHFQPQQDLKGRELKAPTNTPTARGQSVCDSGGVLFPIFPHNGSTPAGLAESLAHSLLSQPPNQILGRQQSCTPASEVKSRKENRLNPTGDPCLPILPSTITPEHHELRKVSQQLYIPSGGGLPVGVASSRTQSPRVPENEPPQRASSMGACRVKATNTAAQARPLTTVSGNAGDKGTKRIRNFTPGSAKAMDEEDEPRASPRMRLSPFVEDVHQGAEG